MSSQQSKKKPRGPNMTTLEDIALCRAFVSIGEDEQVGNAQKYAVLWARVEEAYYALLPE